MFLSDLATRSLQYAYPKYWQTTEKKADFTGNISNSVLAKNTART